MSVREIQSNELHKILALYTHLHEKGVPDDSQHLRDTWEAICSAPNYHIIVFEEEGRIISSCTCVIIPNLTRSVRPYALIENVVTHADYRGRGCATACLNYAREIALKSDCYKMMLITGSQEDSTLRFYQNAGFSSAGKTPFYQLLNF